jgi:hypothetical protein
MNPDPSRHLIAAIDEVVAFFNARKMDLPDGFFDRKTQFVINGAPFETLLGQPPNDPLILMLSRGPAGYRFTVTGLQHAIKNAHIDRGDLAIDSSTPPSQHVDSASPGASGQTIRTRLWLSGQLRDTGEPLNVMIDVTLKLTASGSVEIAAATMDEATLQKIRQARRS